MRDIQAELLSINAKVISNNLRANVWIFDCDGVLLDSNRMKVAAFSQALAEYPQGPTEAFLSFQRAAFGMSRFRLIDVFFENYLQRLPRPGEKDALLSAFSHYCKENYPRQTLTLGAAELLKALQRAGATLYVASGSEQGELRAALTAIGIAEYFREVLGSPLPKSELIGLIRAAHPSDSMIFLGDARADYEAAIENGLPFLYVSGFAADPEGMANLAKTQQFPSVERLDQIALYAEDHH